MYKNKHSRNIKTFFITGFILTISMLSCRKAPVNPPEPVAKSTISVFFNNAYKGLVTENEALAKKDPNSPDKKLTELLGLAKESVDVCMYDIQDPEITKSIVALKKKGLKVRVVTDTTNMTVGKSGELRDSIKMIKDAGIEIKDDKRSPFMHNKFVVIDNKTVWTGSMNFTTNSLYDHNNDSLMIESDKLAANYEAEFNRYFEKGMFSANPHEMPNPEIALSSTESVKTFFSPEGGTTAAILKELNAAKKSIKFMAFAFTTKEIADVILIKNKQKVVCEGVYDSCEIGKYSTYANLKQNKVNVYKDGNQALMHEKTIIIDDNIVITGSFNFSNSAEHNNNENTLIIKSTVIGDVFNKEFERLKAASINNKNLPPYDHPACKGTPTDPNDDGDAG